MDGYSVLDAEPRNRGSAPRYHGGFFPPSFSKICKGGEKRKRNDCVGGILDSTVECHWKESEGRKYLQGYYPAGSPSPSISRSCCCPPNLHVPEGPPPSFTPALPPEPSLITKVDQGKKKLGPWMPHPALGPGSNL